MKKTLYFTWFARGARLCSSSAAAIFVARSIVDWRAAQKAGRELGGRATPVTNEVRKDASIIATDHVLTGAEKLSRHARA